MIEHELSRRTGSTYEAPWSIQQGIEIDPDPLSSSSVGLIQGWLDRCEREHKNCTRHGLTKSSNQDDDREVPLPTRVINVTSPDGISIRLCEGSGKFGKYLALSHRWASGPMPAWVTKKSSVKSRHDWFPQLELPSSVVDAIRVTRELGLQYLWVDSLCIIQDSSNDWDAESSRMADVYANAHFTIFADCGRDDDHGFLHLRPPAPSTSVVVPVKPGLKLELNLRKSVDNDFKSVQKTLFPTNVLSSYLADRGWIFQERVLSRRILHFGKDQMFWECTEGTFAEDGHIVIRRGIRECGRPQDLFSKLTYSSVLDASGPVSPETFANQWENLVSVYSTMKLTRQEDKLYAISGLAAAFQFHVQNDEYVAGIWKNRLVRQLAWSI
ncbi:HET-domain-containing protein, partial [Zopfia rhizophila CBS 207.26]